jgi:hypothetical protein
MNTAAKIHIPVNKATAELTIAHKASDTPFYYVEEAEIKDKTVSVGYFNENDPASEIQTINIPKGELIDFTNEFYRDYSNDGEMLPKAGIEYLQDNLNAVVTDYLNSKIA